MSLNIILTCRIVRILVTLAKTNKGRELCVYIQLVDLMIYISISPLNNYKTMKTGSSLTTSIKRASGIIEMHGMLEWNNKIGIPKQRLQ